MCLPVKLLFSQAESLVAAFQQVGGGRSYVEEAINIDREALQLCPTGHPKRYVSLSYLALHLLDRYNQFGATGDFEEAIILQREALDLCPQGHPERSMSLDNLAIGLFLRYEHFGRMEDLDDAIIFGREALDLRPQGHPNRSTSLNNLASRLSTKYNKLGRMEDLDVAIVLGREALDLCPQGHPNRSMSLNNLAIYLSTRYIQLGGKEDLDEAIILDRKALDLRPQGHPNRSMSLNNLAVRLSTRYNQLGGTEDLDEAIILDREALDLYPQGHPDRSASLNKLAALLSIRRKQLGGMENLDEAIILDREALDLRPQGHPDRSTSLNNLALGLSVRYNQLGRVEDLDQAIALAREALDLCPQGHPRRPDWLNNLARHLCNRFTHLKELKDKEEVFSLYTQLAHVPQIVSIVGFSAAREWIRMAQHFHHPTILLAYESSLQLLTQYLATLPSLPQHLAILKNLTSSLAVDAFSACLHERVPAHAVELLEQGQGVFWSQLTRLRSPLDDLVISDPAGRTLADDFTRLALLIRNTLDSTGAGPVIIVNASKYSCDALIVLLDRDPVHIPLQITQEGVRDLSMELHILTVRAQRFDVTRDLAAFLRKLWDQIVSLIVDFLQMIHPAQSCIWWCPTAEFSVLPLHAAGPYRKGQRNLPNIYISSYTPTLAALIRARRPTPSCSTTRRKSFVTIGQAEAIGESELASVGAELDNIGQSVDSLTTFICIDGEESFISRVVEELGKNDWVHLACHGLPNPQKPFESAFALRDGHFTIQRIIGCNLENPEFAYLSACHTTVGDEESPDEVIHLASAMQFSGFRSVIGTMWAVDDGETNKITSTFYKYMVDESGRLDHTRAAFALNQTMKIVDIPFDQRILYVHLGA
ncbi:CHAT domain-containing protein [Boletus coccyginus]|nr:CHAT domain-containing protein [Boletus coccyginus]